MAEGQDGVVTSTSSAAGLPDEQQRWRCGACGNLTRFDVVRTTTNREFWHLDLAGAAAVEDSTVLEQHVASVTCRWCGRDDAVELVPRLDGSPP
jgi:hypothetical protein